MLMNARFRGYSWERTLDRRLRFSVSRNYQHVPYLIPSFVGRIFNFSMHNAIYIYMETVHDDGFNIIL